MPENTDGLKFIEEYNDFLRISTSVGFKSYEAELRRKIEIYDKLMDNDSASGDLLKNYQLIRKGLKEALAIPSVLEDRAKRYIPKRGGK